MSAFKVSIMIGKYRKNLILATTTAAALLSGAAPEAKAGVFDVFSDAAACARAGVTRQLGIAQTAANSWLGMAKSSFAMAKGVATLDSKAAQEGLGGIISHASTALGTVRSTLANGSVAYDQYAKKHANVDRLLKAGIIYGTYVAAGSVFPAVPILLAAGQMNSYDLMTKAIPMSFIMTNLTWGVSAMTGLLHPSLGAWASKGMIAANVLEVLQPRVESFAQSIGSEHGDALGFIRPYVQFKQFMKRSIGDVSDVSRANLDESVRGDFSGEMAEFMSSNPMLFNPARDT